MVCQNIVCQNKGSKSVLHRLQSLYDEQFKHTYPSLQIVTGECQGDCEQGPVLQVNDSVWLREVSMQQAMDLLQNPEAVLGQVMHVKEQDREIFERIIHGDLF